MKMVVGYTAALLAIGAARAEPAIPPVADPAHLVQRDKPATPPKISAAQAAAKARREHGGKVLDVNLERNGGRPHYRIKLLKNGNVRSVRVPAD